MIRPVLTEIGIFLIPFAVYAVVLLASRTQVLHRDSWPLRTLVKLTIAAFVLVTISLVLLAQFSGAPRCRQARRRCRAPCRRARPTAR